MTKPAIAVPAWKPAFDGNISRDQPVREMGVATLITHHKLGRTYPRAGSPDRRLTQTPAATISPAINIEDGSGVATLGGGVISPGAGLIGVGMIGGGCTTVWRI